MKKTLRSIITVVLVLALGAGLLPAAGLAAEKKAYNAVVFGDTTSQGYMLEGYNAEKLGYGKKSAPTSYPILMEEYLEDYLGTESESYDVTVKNYSFAGMRPNDLYSIFNTDMDPVDKYADCKINDIALALYTDGVIPNMTAEALEKEFKTSVRNADLIVYDLGMMNYGTYFIQRLLWSLDNGYFDEYEFEEDNFDQLMGLYDRDMEELFISLRDALTVTLSKYLDDVTAERLTSISTYCYGSMLVYFLRIMDDIYRLKKNDAQVIVFNLYPNTATGVTLTFGEGADEVKLPMEYVMMPIYESMNIVISSNKTYANKYKLAGITEGVPTFFEEIRNGNMTYNTLERILSDVYAMDENAFGGETGKEEADYYFDETDNFFFEKEQAAVYYDNIVKIANTESVKVDDALAQFDSMNTAAVKAITNYVTATETEIGLAKLWLQFTAGGTGVFGEGFGTMPNEKGTAQKFKAYKNAYTTKFTADGSIFGRIVSGATDINIEFGNILETVLTFIDSFRRSLVEKITVIVRKVTEIINSIPVVRV